MSGKRYDLAALNVPGSVVVAAAQSTQNIGSQYDAAAYQQQQQQQQQQLEQESRLQIQDHVPTEEGNDWAFGTRAEKKGTYPYRLAFFPNRESKEINWGVYFRWCFMTLLMSMIQATAMARVASGLSSSVPALNSVLLGITYAASTMFTLGWRQAFGFTLHTHQSVILAEACHQHIGLVNMLVNLAMNSAGAALSGVFQLPGLLNCAAVPGAPFPASAVTNYWVALGIDAPLGILATLTFLHNIPLMYHGVSGELLPSETKRDRFAVTNVSVLFALALFLFTVIGFPSGIWAMGNSVIYIGGAITLGASTPFEWAWSIPLLWSCVYGVIAFGIHLLTFNVNGLSEEDFIAGGATPSAPAAASTEARIVESNINKKLK